MSIMAPETSRRARALSPRSCSRRATTPGRRAALLLGAGLLVAQSAVSRATAAPTPTPTPARPAPTAPPAARKPAPPAPAKPPQLVTRAAPEKPEAAFEESIGVSWILVPVTVKNRRGHVRGLDRNDFSLKVDGRYVKFADFEARGEVPWSIVFLQDLSGSMALGGNLEMSKRAIRAFLDAARPGDEFALASFAGEVTAIDVPFTENQRPLRETLERWEAYGKTALHDAVSLLPQVTGESRNVKRAAVLITDGSDNASRISPNRAREIVRSAQLPVFVLGLESGDPYAVSAEGDKLSRYADVLNLLSHSTGGRYIAVDGAEGLSEACRSIAEELRWQYVLGFETAATGQNRFRPITVEVGKRGVDVAFRRGYRGLPPARR